MNKHHFNKAYSEDNIIATIYNQTNNLLDCVLRCVVYKDDIDSSWIEEINDICIHIFNITREIKDNNLISNIFKHFLLPTTTIEDYFKKITTFQYKNAQNNRYPEFKRKCIDARRFIIVYLLFVNELANIANDENPKLDFKYSFNKCFELMDITDVSKYGLSDIAYGLTYAMDMCFELGEEFVAHFDKIYKSNSKNTLYICSQKMQRLFDIAKSINLRYNRKKINEKQLYDWFMTIGKLQFDLFDNNDEADKYDVFANKLLDQNIKALDALRETLLNGEKNKHQTYPNDNRLSREIEIANEKCIRYISNEMYLYSEISDYYKKNNDYFKAYECIRNAYNKSKNILGIDDLTTGQMARKLARLYSDNNKHIEAIEFYEIAYRCFIHNKRYLSRITKNSFKSLCHLYIITQSMDKLNTLIAEREELLLSLNAELYEIIDVIIEIGDYEEAYYLLIDQYDILYSVYGKNYNYTQLGILFAKVGDKHSALHCLDYSQNNFIRFHKTKNNRIERLLNKIIKTKSKKELMQLFK